MLEYIESFKYIDEGGKENRRCTHVKCIYEGGKENRRCSTVHMLNM